MTQDEQDLLFLRATRAEDNLQNQLAAIESKLQETGRSLVAFSRELSKVPPVFNTDKSSLEASVAEIWELQKRYEECSAALDERRREISRYRTAG